ncbi:MAG: DUF2288 domain-containing protein [Microcoleaceae cyanobacterium]
MTQDLNPDPNQALRDQLAENLDEAEWEWLVPHYHKDMIVMVNQQLDLIDVGVALAQDKTIIVRRWMEEQLIYKPLLEQVTNWERDRSTRFKALIVQPFVLVQQLVEQKV